jgi:glycine/D-amino acid oxidase-like deaminating enzyme
MPVVGNGYLVPTATGCVLGASYEHRPWLEDEATAHNLQLNQHLLGGTRLSWNSRRRGARCVSSDRTPVVGQLHSDGDSDALWLHTGLGSMGTTAGVVGAAALSAALLGWLPPLAPEVAHLLRPERFRERQARRGVRHIEPLQPQ